MPLLMDRIAGNARRLLRDGPVVTPAMRGLVGRTDGRPGPADEAAAAAAIRRAARGMVERLEGAARFRIGADAVAALRPLMDRPARLLAGSRHMFLPAATTWIETEAPERERVAVLASCAGDSLTAGSAGVYSWHAGAGDYVAVPVDFDLASPGRLVRYLADAGPQIEAAIGEAAGGGIRADLGRIGLLLLALLALLCSPGLWERREVDLGRLNRARAARGAWPLLAYHEVRLAVDGTPPTVTPGTGGGPPRALHFVRAHLRVRSNGRVELVRPHWRGDARRGVKRPAYRVTA